MLPFTQDDLVQVIFSNNDRTEITVTYRNEKGDKIAFSMRANPEEPYFQQLLTMISLDEIEAGTLDQINALEQQIIELHKQMIEDGTAVIPAGAAAQEFEPDQTLKFFLDFDDTFEDAQEALFALKLAAFEMEAVEIASIEQKEQIRSASTPLELVLLIKELL